MFYSESVPPNISYKFFKTWNLPVENSYTVITETLESLGSDNGDGGK